MCQKGLRALVFMVVVLMIVGPGHAQIDPESILGIWLLDEGSGDVTEDSSGNGNNGTIMGSPGWVTGQFGNALDFDGSSHVNCGSAEALNVELFSVSFWCNIPSTQGWNHMISRGSHVASGTPGSVNWGVMMYSAQETILYETFNDTGWTGIQTPAAAGEWHHVVATFDGDAMQLFIDGGLAANTSGAGVLLDESRAFVIGARSDNGAAGGFFTGSLDEVGYFSAVISPTDIQALMDEGLSELIGAKPEAVAPQPGNGVTDVRWDAQLGWTAGDFAVAHDVYFGTSFDEVANGSRTAPGNVLVSEAHPDTTYAPGKLALDTPYYWRVDEVNSPPDSTIFKGTVWSFTVEPVSYPLPMGAVSAAASSVDGVQVPDNTVNGSGLNANDEHFTTMEDMWLAATTDPMPWIQFDFEQEEKFDKAHVWNHNTQSEGVLGFGIKEALIETSLDGATWTEFGTVELAQATGLADYAGFDLSLDGMVAQHIKLTALSNWSLLGLPQKGLSEVRFFTLPVLAREPMPADGSTTDGVEVTLDWRPGREVDQHEVLFGENRQAVIDGSAGVGTVDVASFDVGTLDLGTEYFWKIDEVNDAETPSVYEGNLWSFLTPDQIMIEDFEMYKAKEGLFIWEHWIDGFDNPDENGAVVGNGDDAETSIVYEGSQSMPLAYDNTTAPKSEATRTFDPPLDLAVGNPESIEVYVRGIPYEFNGYYSVDGSSWTSMSWNPRYIVMSEDAHVGMAVCSHDVALETSAVYTSVSTTGNVTGDWTQADIGGTHPSGNFTEANGTFTIKALGADIWTAADEFRYVYKNLDGPGSITAQVENLDPVNAWTKVGVMIRDTTDVGASNGGVYATGTNGVRYQARLDTDIAATSDTSVLDGTQEIMSAPVWVRMERTLANDAAPIYMTLTDTSGKSATIESEDTAATTIGSWTLLSGAPGDLNVNLSKIEAITIGVSGANVEGKIYVDAIRMARPYPRADEVTELATK